MKLPSLLCALALTPALLASTQEVPDIGSRRELFVDRFLVETMKGVNLQLHHPHDEGEVLRFDQPWEGQFAGYCTVIHEGGKYHLYYRGKEGGADGSREVTCYATSEDGRKWVKPKLGLHEVGGSRNNNVILTDRGITHNFSPFLDTRPGVPVTERFKALGGIIGNNASTGGLHAYGSEDGIHWKNLYNRPVVTKGAFDSQNVAFWSPLENRYVCVMRIFTKGTVNDKKWRPTGLRSMSRSTSQDFVNWTDPVPMKFQPRQEHHLYTSQTHPYFRAPHLYVATAARFLPNNAAITDEEAVRLKVEPSYYKSAKDVSDSVLLTSRDGETYDQTFQEGFIRPSTRLSEWVSRTGYPALNVVQTGPEEMSVYANQDYAQPTAHLRRYSMRLDGFASVHAPYEGGELVTRPFIFAGSRLVLNFATSAAGSVRVEIQDASGKPIPGHTAGDSVEMVGNALERAVSWKSGLDVSKLAGKPMRLRFLLKDADLYAMRFAREE